MLEMSKSDGTYSCVFEAGVGQCGIISDPALEAAVGKNKAVLTNFECIHVLVNP